MNPRISICVPNLNMRPFLAERFATIFGQTFQDWELLVYDSHSDDGAWEYIQELATHEKRMRIWQGPREGVYPAWNECIRQTRGEYVYMATSDDTMAADCLEKLVAALEKHPECDLAHCPVRITGENGAPFTELQWPDCTSFSQGDDEWRYRPHVRRAPYDGFLHLLGKHVYLSFTQLLIRRSLFAKVGDFPSQWGTMSDFNWEMKASMVADTAHVPDTWATWRIHKKQLTDLTVGSTLEYQHKVDQMMVDAVEMSLARLDPAVARGLESHWLALSLDMRSYYRGLRHRPTALQRRWFQLARLFAGSAAARSRDLGSIVRAAQVARDRPGRNPELAGIPRSQIPHTGMITESKPNAGTSGDVGPQGEWTLRITAHRGWMDWRLGQLWRYRDLIRLFVWRDFVAVYKQTILGPLWHLIQPLLTTLMFTLIFGRVARLPTDGVPPFLFYLSGTVVWSYFANCLTSTSNTFVANAHLLGKVYFHRMAIPVSVTISNLISFGIQLVVFLAFLSYHLMNGATVHLTGWVWLAPLLVLMLAGFGLGGGIIVSALTTRYRDLAKLVGFGVQLLMFATPVIYPASAFPERYRWVTALNPLTPVVEGFRLGFLGVGTVSLLQLAGSFGVMLALLVVGLMLFTHIERTFMDTV